jgi:hypothetical protein
LAVLLQYAVKEWLDQRQHSAQSLVEYIP